MAMPVPDDALATVLRRLPPRSLAVAQCVCKPWRALLDSREVLLPHVLPRSVHGLLLNYIDHYRPHLFSRPRYLAASGARIDGNLPFLPIGDYGRWSILDHCDSLLLCNVGLGSRLCVCNPATRRWATLPPRPEDAYSTAGKYLAFDPAVSRHYGVFLIPDLPEKPLPRVRHQWTMEEVEEPSVESPPSPSSSTDDDDDVEQLYWLAEWPPSPCKIQVFSSRTGLWEEKEFVREDMKKTHT